MSYSLIMSLIFWVFVVTDGYSGEEDFGEILTTITNGPNIASDCDHPAIDKINKKAETYIKLSLRNDAFAVPYTFLKNNHLLIWDLGETHASSFTVGHQTKSGHDFNISFSTKLFTDALPIWNEDLGYFRYQNFTTENIVIGEFSNKERDQNFIYTIGLGKINYNSTHNDSLWSAEGQQSYLHHKLDKKVGVNLIDFENLSSNSKINGSSFLLVPSIGKKMKLAEGLEINPYISARITKIAPANFISTGAKIEKEFLSSDKKNSVNINLDIPAIIYKDYLKNERAVALIPKITLSSTHRNIEYGFQFEKPFGNWQMNIPQNVPTKVMLPDSRIITDDGEMGEIFIKIKK